MAKKPINLRIDGELWGAVQELAVRNNRTATSVVEHALRVFVVESGKRAQPYPPAVAHHEGLDEPSGLITTPAVRERYDKILGEAPPTAQQLRGRTGLPLAACQRHIDKGTWRTLL
jgi:hypothetical protein